MLHRAATPWNREGDFTYARNGQASNVSCCARLSTCSVPPVVSSSEQCSRLGKPSVLLWKGKSGMKGEVEKGKKKIGIRALCTPSVIATSQLLLVCCCHTLTIHQEYSQLFNNMGNWLCLSEQSHFLNRISMFSLVFPTLVHYPFNKMSVRNMSSSEKNKFFACSKTLANIWY